MHTRHQPNPHTNGLIGWPHLSIVASAVLSSLASLTQAAPLPLAQVPQGNGGRQPAPNVLVSVDDSGSMDTDDARPAGVTPKLKRIAALRDALTSSFSTSKVPDDSIRLGFQALWGCRGFGSNQTNSRATACPENRIRPFSSAHRTGFNTWVNSLTASGSTPSHDMMKRAGEYMKTTGTWNPYAKNPGTQETPLLACRKSFQIFMTDGEWNGQTNGINNHGSADNADGITRVLPDGTNYDTSAGNTQTRVYRDGVGSTTLSTMADYAFLYWATDLQPSIPNQVIPNIRFPGSVNYGTAGSPYMLEEYWNPRNNPATWQNLTTYTISFGSGSAPSTAIAPRWGWSNDPRMGINWYAGDYPGLVTGAVNWGNPIAGPNINDALRKDLWHMAVNSRGRYILANNSTELQAAFDEILDQIFKDTSTPIASISASTQTARADTMAFIAGYNANNWSGELTGYSVNTDGTIAPIIIWNAALQLGDDASLPHTDRKIFTQHQDGSTASFSALGGGKAFNWTDLSTTQRVEFAKGLNWEDLTAIQQTDYTADIDTVTAMGASNPALKPLAYIRGQRSQEVANGGTLRNRASRMGDIVNSAPWFVGAPGSGYEIDSYKTFRQNNAGRLPMVYVGANDGMLHGFAVKTTRTNGVTSLVDGTEKMAYVPRGVMPNLIKLTNSILTGTALTSTTYTHRYFVDGKPFTGDFFHSNTSTWKTALVGTLAGGGRGFFILDVTNPAGFATATATDVAAMVITDKTDTFTPSASVGLPAATWADIGHMYSSPTLSSSNTARAVQVTKLNNDRWAVLLGNGINSADETASLLIQYLDGDRELVKLTAAATVGDGNGLSHPQVIDLNGDEKADVVYAGDLKGNLWKFDLTSATPSNWNVAFSGQPFFVAKGDPSGTATTGDAQAIMTAPTWVYNRVVTANGTVNGINLIFGTGRDVTATDPASTAVQTLYSVWDNTHISYSYNPVTGAGAVTLSGGTAVPSSASGGRTSLNAISQTSSTAAAAGQFMTTSTTTFNYTGTGSKRGWFFNLPVAGERVLTSPSVLDKRLIAMPTVKPMLGSLTSSSDESCEPNATPAQHFMTLLDATTGLQRPFFDTNADGVFNGSDIASASRVATGADPTLFIPTKTSKAFETGFKLVSSRPGANQNQGVAGSTLDSPVRISWRHLQ